MEDKVIVQEKNLAERKYQLRPTMIKTVIAGMLVLLSSCQQEEGVAVLGGGTHDLDSVNITTVATSSEGLAAPRDLAFNPEVPGELWVVNSAKDGVLIIADAGGETQSYRRSNGAGSYHFLSRPSSLAFGASGTMATAHDQDLPTQEATPADFMGPTLWSTAPDLFEGGHASHLDMLHNSPLGAGIAWEKDNTYWIFDGFHNSITRYNFNNDHGPGGADHRDGEVRRYAEGEVSYVESVSSHMEMDQENGKLYIADSGNGRIAVLDTGSGTLGSPIFPNYDGTSQYYMNDAAIVSFVEEVEDAPLFTPSGIALRDDMVFVSDNASSTIFAFDIDTAELVDWLDLSTKVTSGGLMGIEFDSEGNLFLTDKVNNTVLKLER